MGREASAEPGRPPAYGRRGPCRWRSKGQRAETARELTLGNEVPSPPAPAPRPELRPGLARGWCVHRDPGRPDEGPEERGAGALTSETPGLVAGAKPRGSDIERGSLAARRRTRPSGHGHAGGYSYRNLSGKRPFDFSPLFGGEGELIGGGEGARGAAARGQQAARRGEGRGGPEHNFPGRLCERRRSLLALQPSQ